MVLLCVVAAALQILLLPATKTYASSEVATTIERILRGGAGADGEGWLLDLVRIDGWSSAIVEH